MYINKWIPGLIKSEPVNQLTSRPCFNAWLCSVISLSFKSNNSQSKIDLVKKYLTTLNDELNQVIKSSYRTLAVGWSFTVRLVSSLTGLNPLVSVQVNNNIFSWLVKSNPVKLETSHTVIHSPTTVHILWFSHTIYCIKCFAESFPGCCIHYGGMTRFLHCPYHPLLCPPKPLLTPIPFFLSFISETDDTQNVNEKKKQKRVKRNRSSGQSYKTLYDHKLRLHCCNIGNYLVS